jgi:hypothetical protein
MNDLLREFLHTRIKLIIESTDMIEFSPTPRKATFSVQADINCASNVMWPGYDEQCVAVIPHRVYKLEGT